MNRNKSAITSLLAFVLFMFPLVAVAENGISANSDKKITLCEKMVEKISAVGQKMTAWENKINDKQNNILKSINNKRENRIGQLKEIRGKWNQSREEHYQKLREKAITKEQKQAVETFIAAMQTAIKIRNEAFDKAINEFQIKLDNLIALRQVSVKQKTGDYKRAVSQVYDTAKTECQQETFVIKVQQNLKIALNNAKEQYRNKINPEQNYKDEMEALVKEKRDSVKKATDVFHGAIQQAVDVLRAVFKEA